MTSKHVKEKQIQPFANKNCCYQSIQPASKHSYAHNYTNQQATKKSGSVSVSEQLHNYPSLNQTTVN